MTHFIKNTNQAAQEALSARNWRAPRTYFHVTYRHDTGADWCAIVEEVQPGEVEITEAEWQAITDANCTFNVAYELDLVEAKSAALDRASVEDLLPYVIGGGAGLDEAQKAAAAENARMGLRDRLTNQGNETLAWVPPKAAEAVSEVEAAVAARRRA